MLPCTQLRKLDRVPVHVLLMHANQVDMIFAAILGHI
jgi:hypothetical protein